MLFVRNAQDPIYNSLSDLKSGTPTNEWFNLSVYDESSLSQTAQEIESILTKIPESFFSRCIGWNLKKMVKMGIKPVKI